MWTAQITEVNHQGAIEKWTMAYESLERLCRELSYTVDDDFIKEIHITKGV